MLLHLMSFGKDFLPKNIDKNNNGEIKMHEKIRYVSNSDLLMNYFNFMI